MQVTAEFLQVDSHRCEFWFFDLFFLKITIKFFLTLLLVSAIKMIFFNYIQRTQRSSQREAPSLQRAAVSGAEWVLTSRSDAWSCCQTIPPLKKFVFVAGRVFVTYEADNDKHVNEIIKFVALLRHNGFDTHVRAAFSLFVCFVWAT